MTDYNPLDRRPIATREKAWSRAVAGRLIRMRISPNAISLFGMCAAMGAGVALWGTAHWPEGVRLLWVAAAVGIQLRLAANMFDGMVAVESGVASPVGEIYNELTDRISDAAVLIGLGYAVGGNPEFGYIATALAILTTYIRALGKVAGAEQHFVGPMAKPHRMFLVTLLALYLAMSPAAWQPAWAFRWIPGLPAGLLALITLGCVVTCFRRLRRVMIDLPRSRA